MKKIKYTIPMFSFYDRTGIQNYLQTQAAKGWMLEKAGTYCWRFRRMEPRMLKFSVVYFPEADLYDPAPGDGEQTFRELCEHSGWHFVGSQAQMQIFYSESENPVPIDTDPVIEVENIHKSMKKSALPSYWSMVGSSIIWIANVILNWTTNPLRCLSSNLYLYFSIFWPSMILLSAGRLICYHRWRKKAKRAAAEGEFLESRGFARIEQLWLVLVTAGLVVCVFFGRSQVTSFGVIFGVVVALGILVVEYITRETLKKKGYNAAETKVKTIVITLSSVLVLSIIMAPITFNVVERMDDGRDRELYIELSDLVDVEYKTMVMEDTESILLGCQRVVHYTDQEGPITELQYQVIPVKAHFLYDLCLENAIQTNRYAMVPTDSTPWGAIDAQVCLWEEELWGYLLCYEDYIVTVWPNWEMTEAQMAMIGRIFN